MKGFFLLPVLLLAAASAGAAQVTEIEKELIAFEDAWALAVQEGDTEVLDQIIGDDYIGTTATGAIQTKEDYLAGFLSGARKTFSLTTEDLRVRMYEETAVLTHGGQAEGELNNKPTNGKYRWTHVLVKREGRWEAVANHVTRIPDG